ncbi:DUF1851 domain-containing protein [Nocardioides zeae]|uniref:DUF1851 domain-containing protein n=1 Tax=Nocardioides imazamoxiresistens TaxID=3231893 RepID=A0ABU3PUZ9_9ACTN|nr:T6SS immunity protein Tdi1 domain-containing protein [Nocardioides zeae]MDT9593064.1 DUF1851 domain-containing protein [Nocardioides zeae]
MPVELLRPVTDDDLRGLAEWTWLEGITALRPWLVTACADVLLQDDDGGVWFLSTTLGTLERHWDDVDALRAALGDQEQADEFLSAWLVEGAARRGLEPGPGQALVLVPAPAVGGAYAVDNLAIYDTVVALSLAGQLHRQLQHGPAAG